MLAAFQFQYPQALPWVILLVAVVSLLILLSYRAQLQQLPPRARWLPPVLRILAATALCISILRPVVTRDRIASERAPLLILVDNSHSMSIVDATRSPGEWVGIAAALGRLPTDARDRQITALQSDCDRLTTQAYQVGRARAELDYAQLAGKGLDNAQVQLNQAISVFQSIARDTSGAARAVKRMPQLEKTLAYLERIPTRVDRQEWLDNITAKSRGVAIDAETARLNSDTHLFQTDARIRDACLPLQSLSRVQISDAAVFDSVNGLLARLGVDAPFHAYAVGRPGHASARQRSAGLPGHFARSGDQYQLERVDKGDSRIAQGRATPRGGPAVGWSTGQRRLRPGNHRRHPGGASVRHQPPASRWVEGSVYY